jgi:hypothetical protein
MRRLAVWVIPFLSLTLALGAVGCGGEATPAIETEGALPVLNVGDRWVERAVAEEGEHTVTFEVTGEDQVDGRDCYVLDTFVDPQLPWLAGSVTSHMDKTTGDVIRNWMSGEVQGTPFLTVIAISYETSGDPTWPRQVGNEWEVVETETATISAGGETTSESATRVLTRRVETVEEVTVPAGTFQCFKIVEYDEDGIATRTSWHSYRTKHWRVKLVFHDSGDVVELVSYSLH